MTIRAPSPLAQARDPANLQTRHMIRLKIQPALTLKTFASETLSPICTELMALD